MDNAHYERLRAKIEAAYRADIAALDRLRAADERLSEEAESPAKLPVVIATETNTHAKEQSVIHIDPLLEADKRSVSRTVGKGDVLNAILEAAQDLPVTFNVNQVIEKIKELRLLADVKESSVRQAIGKIADSGKLKIVSRGAGRAPSIYSLPSGQIPISALEDELDFKDI
jgi:hypothetical protein